MLSTSVMLTKRRALCFSKVHIHTTLHEAGTVVVQKFKRNRKEERRRFDNVEGPRRAR